MLATRLRLRALAVLVATVVYVLSPVDAIPDYIPFVGWVDDLLVALAAIYFLCRQLTSGALRNPSRDKIIDAR